ncbi:vegetative cell wall protein gp1-like [Iris pallida]|uniref:Vegetative cell wall protein gp1-like n=1 Tax=Iris pallida TaxID=29817 RepID=A0AAX6I3X8_IRIPA|nr:vegetative cell wall protein gp1-like [Iris pallida]
MVAAPEVVASGEVRLGRYMDFFFILFCFVSSVGHRILCTGIRMGWWTRDMQGQTRLTRHIFCVLVDDSVGGWWFNGGSGNGGGDEVRMWLCCGGRKEGWAATPYI